MTLFQPSQKAVSAACQEIADCVGASADAEMLNRAGRSLAAAFEHFNSRAYWRFNQSEQAPFAVVAPFSVTGITASAGAASAACPAGHGVQPYDFILGFGWGNGVRVSATAASGFGTFLAASGFNGTATGSASFNRDMYDLPSDYKASYSVRLLNSNNLLRPINRRLYDRSTDNEQTVSRPAWYDVYMVGSVGKMRILPPPTTNDVLQHRYNRRMSVPSATAITAALDIPQDYEIYVLAWAKWHFITDKSEGRGDQLKTWFALSEEGLKTMMRQQTRWPDEDLMFVPGQFQYGTFSDTTTRFMDWNYTT